VNAGAAEPGLVLLSLLKLRSLIQSAGCRSREQRHAGFASLLLVVKTSTALELDEHYCCCGSRAFPLDAASPLPGALALAETTHPHKSTNFTRCINKPNRGP
jgi:hypothetical protein